MRQQLHLRRRRNVWYWRRRLPPRAGRGFRCLDLSLRVEDRATARRIATALNAVFEELMAQDENLPPGAEAAIMQAARDTILRRLATERAGRGPDPSGRARPVAINPIPLAPEVVEELARFLDGVGDQEPDARGSIAPVPTGLADALKNSLPAPKPPAATLPSRTAAARERALLAKGIAKLLAADLAANDLSAAEPFMKDILAMLGLNPQGTARHLAAEAVMAGLIQAYRTEVDRNLGIPIPPEPAATLGNPVHATPAAPEPATPAPPDAGSGAEPPPATLGRTSEDYIGPDMVVSAAFERLRKAKRVAGQWNDESERDAGTAVRIFIELMGDLPLRRISRNVGIAFRDDVSDICSDWGQSRLYADPVPGNRNKRVDARRAVEISRGRPGSVKRLSAKTIFKHIEFLDELWDWAAENAGCAGMPHPFKGLVKKPPKKQKRTAESDGRDAFRIAEIQKIFTSERWKSTSPFTTEAQEALKRNAKPSFYFGVLLGAYCGMRESEICQLRVGDINVLDDFAIIHIRALDHAAYAAELGGGRHTVIKGRNRVKTPAAARKVPLHPVLVRCGFLRYRELRGGAPSDLLFPEVPAKADDRGRNLSGFFLRLRRALGLTRPGLDFHSLRHTARTMLDAITRDANYTDRIIGHDGGPAAQHVRDIYNKGYWQRPEYEALAKLSYGIAAFGESTELVDLMRRDAFILALDPQ
ncbi:MAG: tyrosine-type recombinase/integrase [Firmicutes bacterium]|nr:tyrosine-type recombinase/integrase [Bacillota bacterium]